MASSGGNNTFALKRLLSEYKAYQIASSKGEYGSNFTISPFSDADGNQNMFRWTGIIVGQSGTPYDGGKFGVDIQIPGNYPVKPPTVKFTNYVYHPNIDPLGNICLDILKPETQAWNPTWGLARIMMALITLLQVPEPNDPLRSDAAEIYINDRDKFNELAKEATRAAK